MKAKKPTPKKGGNNGPLFISVALGAALAAGAGYYVTHKEEIDREAKKQIDMLARLFKETRSEVEKRVRKVWGEVSHEAVATYMDARGALLHMLENEVVEKTGKLVQKNYNEAVDNVIRAARKSGMLTPDVEEKLAEMLKMDWKDVQKIFESGMKMVESAAKQGMKMMSKPAKKGSKKVAKKKPVAKKTAKKAVGKKSSGKKGPAKRRR